jgi:hypothetical protein
MKVTDLALVCEKCNKGFVVGDKFTIVSPRTVTDVTLYDGAYFPFDNSPSLGLGYQQWYHTACLDINPPPANLKEAVNKLSSKEQIDLYKYLYYTHRCRI